MIQRRITVHILACAALAAALLVGAAGCKKEAPPEKPPEGQPAEESKSTMQKAGEKTGEFFRAAQDKTGAAAETVKDKTVETATTVKDKTVETFEKAKEGTKDFVEGVKEGYNGTTEPPAETSPEAATEGKAATYSVVLTAPGVRILEVIKTVREEAGLGLADAKDLVDAAPKSIKGGLSQEEAEALKKKLEAAGAKAEIRQE